MASQSGPAGAWARAGRWYDELPLEKTESGSHGFAPAHCFGQWISALARGYAGEHGPRTKAKLEKILALYEPAISGRFYKNFRFPAYNYDKFGHRFDRCAVHSRFTCSSVTISEALPRGGSVILDGHI